VDWNNVTGSFHDHFEIICGFEQIRLDSVNTKFELLCGLEQIEIMLSCPNLKCCVDWNDVTGSFYDKFEVLCELEQMLEDEVITKFEVLCGLQKIVK
jgi:hypothetical protein